MDVTDLPHVDAGALADMVDPATSALVVVDVQVDFASPEGALGARGVDMSAAAAAIDRMEAVIRAARAAGTTVVFLLVATTPQTDSGALRRLYARKGRPEGARAICREGTKGFEPYRLIPEEGDLVVPKRQFDGFHGTGLAERLRAKGVNSLFMMGLTTDCCVDQTTRSAFHHDFDVFVVSDACASYDPRLHLGALMAIEKNCGLLTDAAAVEGMFHGKS